MEKEQRMLTARDVAAQLQCSRQYVYLLVGSGELGSVKVGRLRRFTQADIDDFLARRREGQLPQLVS